MKNKNIFSIELKSRDKEHENASPIQELSDNEIQAVSGGFWGALVAVLSAALAGCATMSHKGDRA